MPLGAYDESAGWFPQSQAMDEVWAQEFQPLLDGMRNVAVENLNNPTMTGMYSQLSPDAQKQLNNYLKVYRATWQVRRWQPSDGGKTAETLLC